MYVLCSNKITHTYAHTQTETHTQTHTHTTEHTYTPSPVLLRHERNSMWAVKHSVSNTKKNLKNAVVKERDEYTNMTGTGILKYIMVGILNF